MKSWKIGAVSGLIAGIGAGLIVHISSLFLPMIGRTETSFSYFNEITINLIWGIIFGIIYSRTYNMIPGKGIVKGIFYGLLVFFFTAFREAIWMVAYLWFYEAISVMFVYFFGSIAYGLVLGILYEEPTRRLGKFDMTKSALVGAIAGILGGIAAYLMQIIDNIFHYQLGSAWMEISFIIFQLSTHVGVHSIYGMIFGAIFTIVYSLVPKKGISKGIIYGLIAYLITDVHFGVRAIIYGITTIPGLVHEGFATIYIGFIAFLVFGIVIGYLYKPTK